MTHFMEQSYHLTMLKQQRLGLSGLGEVADKKSQKVELLASFISVSRKKDKVDCMVFCRGK